MAAAGRSIKRAILTTALLLALPAGVAAQSAPDLQVNGPFMGESVREGVEPGETFRILVTVQNLGAEWSSATTVRFYRSTDTTITASDTEVGTERVGPLGHLSGSGNAIILTAPSKYPMNSIRKYRPGRRLGRPIRAA